MPSASRVVAPADGGGGGGGGRFKRALLRNLILGLRKGGVVSREMAFHDRKTAIKRAADAALATARGAAPRWSRSLAAELASPGEPRNNSPPPSSSRKMMICRRIILRRSLLLRRRRPRPASATAKACGGGGGVARDKVRTRASVLKGIVPGGRDLDMCALLGETLDYAVSLKAQVDVMQLLVRTLQEQKKLK